MIKMARTTTCLPFEAKWNAENMEAACVYHHLTFTKWLNLELCCKNTVLERVTNISQRINPMAGTFRSRARISEFSGTLKAAPDAIMIADMALAGQPRFIPVRVAPGLY